MAKNKKKQQTQLAFVPLSPDSPASQSQPPETRSRAAAVGISPSKRRGKITEAFLPSPVASSQQLTTSQPTQNSSSKKQSRKKPRSTFMTRSQAPRSSSPAHPVQASNANAEIIDLFSDSESDVEPVISPLKSRRARRQATVELSDDSRDRDDDDDDDDDDDEPKTPSRRTWPRKPRRSLSNQTDDELEQQDPDRSPEPAPKRRRLLGPRTPRKVDDGEDEELKEDLEFLRSDSPERPGRYISSQMSAKRSQKLSALEALKKSRRKAHKDQSRRGNPQIISDDDDENDNENEHEEDGSDSDVELSLYEEVGPLHAAMNDDSFIVEDDGEAEQIPMEFKMQLMKPGELFEFVVEWMCQKRFNPAFAIDDDVYMTAFRRLNDYVKGMGGSKFTSSAWTADFTRTLNARPGLEEEHFVNDGSHDRCDACNRSGHPATWKIWFQGDVYNKETLEDEDEEDIPLESRPSNPRKTWYLGKFCMANAKTAHTLAHWRFHLYNWVVEYLEEEGYLDANRVLERDRWSTRKRRDYANSVADQMKASNVTRRLYKDFKDEVDIAQNQNHQDYLN